jgi:hypothetical protein
MADVLVRKCAKCKDEIIIHKNSISNVIQFQNKYYHYDCFENLAAEKAASKRGKPQMWQEALDNIWVIEDETKKILEQFIAKDELNTWLLSNYDIVTVPSYFWQLVADLERGIYKRKKCKPVKIFDLCECWKWGQRNLNKIAINNKMHHKGPGNDTDRLRYDLAILITKYPLFLKHKAKTSATILAESFERNQPKIDYGVLEKNNKNDDENDILDLIDEVF